MELQLHYLNNKSQFLIGKVEQVGKKICRMAENFVSIPYR